MDNTTISNFNNGGFIIDNGIWDINHFSVKNGYESGIIFSAPVGDFNNILISNISNSFGCSFMVSTPFRSSHIPSVVRIRNSIFKESTSTSDYGTGLCGFFLFFITNRK